MIGKKSNKKKFESMVEDGELLVRAGAVIGGVATGCWIVAKAIRSGYRWLKNQNKNEGGEKDELAA